jgi:hypothetical protein
MKLPDPAAQTAKYVNMMNATRQQEASQRQADIAQKTLVLQQERGAREEAQQAPTLTKMEQDNLVQALSIFREGVTDIADGDLAAAEALRADLVSRVPPYEKFILPASQWTPEYKFQLKTTAEQEIQKTIATPTTETIFGPKNEILELTKGGAPGVAGLRPVLNKPAAGATPAAAPRTPVVPTAAPQKTTPGPVPVGKYGETRVIPDNAVPLTDFEQEDIRRIREGSGMANTPASFTRGGMGQMSPDMVPAILDSAVKTGVMAQIDLDQMLAMTPPQARDGIIKVIRDSNIALQADAPSLVTSGMNQQQPMAPNPVGRQQSTYADMRGLAPRASFADLGSAPPVQTTRAQTNVMGQQAYGRSASPTSPIPGSSLVAPQVLGSQKAAETAGSENVKVGTQPRIVAGEERVRRLEKLRGEMPIAQAETQTLVNSLTGRINAIDEYLRSGSRNSIIGTVEGRIPKFFQSETRADAQGLYDYITSNTVLQKLIDDRGQTETGGSPQGVVSDADLKVAAQASTKLTQTGSERRQEIEMQRLRDELYRTRGQAIQKYNNVYREVIKEAPELGLKVRPVAPKYKSAPQTPTRAKSLKNIFGG